MTKFIVAGIGTDVGKTLVSAVLTTALEGEYWKPVQTGNKKDSDVEKMKSLIDSDKYPIHESCYSFNASLSPHHAARLENSSINVDQIIPPQTNRPLIIESVGGIFVPLTHTDLSFDLFKSWNSSWIIVSRHYLGSINHTLLTLNALKQNKIKVSGIIFNGYPNPDSEKAILNFSSIPVLGRLLPESTINSQIIQKYATQWQSQLLKIL